MINASSMQFRKPFLSSSAFPRAFCFQLLPYSESRPGRATAVRAPTVAISLCSSATPHRLHLCFTSPAFKFTRPERVHMGWPAPGHPAQHCSCTCNPAAGQAPQGSGQRRFKREIGARRVECSATAHGRLRRRRGTHAAAQHRRKKSGLLCRQEAWRGSRCVAPWMAWTGRGGVEGQPALHGASTQQRHCAAAAAAAAASAGVWRARLHGEAAAGRR
jgi:hypothetical protein